ncbi:hypothetical protein Ga0451573_001825 [Peptococcaceae bacterium DYL19]|nr:hypothetical protein [Phosphitispora fastidiosa]
MKNILQQVDTVQSAGTKIMPDSRRESFVLGRYVNEIACAKSMEVTYGGYLWSLLIRKEP